MIHINDIDITVSGPESDEDEDVTTVTAEIHLAADAKLDNYALAQAKGHRKLMIEKAAIEARAKVFAYLYGDIRGIFADLIFELRRSTAENTALRHAGERNDALRGIEEHLTKLGLL